MNIRKYTSVFNFTENEGYRGKVTFRNFNYAVGEGHTLIGADFHGKNSVGYENCV